MLNKSVFLIILLFSVSVCFFSCSENSEAKKVQNNSEVKWPDNNSQAKNDSTGFLSFSNMNHRNDDGWKQMRSKVAGIINGGQYNIISVKTFYSDADLTSVDILYNISRSGEGNRLRVMFLESEFDHMNSLKRNDDIRAQLTEKVNSGKYNISDIRSVYDEGYLVAAEIYYKVDIKGGM